MGYEIRVMDTTTYPLPMAAVVLIKRINQPSNKVAIVYTYLVEASAAPLSNRSVNLPNHGAVEIITVPSDVYDSKYLGHVTDMVSGLGADTFVNAGYFVIHSELDSDDADAVLRVASNGINAVETIAVDQGFAKEPFFSVKSLEVGTQFQAHIDYSPAPIHTIDGLPIRGDIRVGLRIAPPRQNNNVNNEVNFNPEFPAEQELVSLYCHIDLDLVMPMMGALREGNQPDNRRYYPRMIIDQLQSGTQFHTMETMGLALANASALATNSAWAGGLKPRAIKGTDLRDIAGLLYDVYDVNNPPPKIDTKSDSFTREEFFKMVDALIHRKMIYTVAIQEGGQNSWVEAIMCLAADGNPNANAAIIRAFDRLTSGEFSKLYPSTTVIAKDVVRLPVGYYRNDNNELRPTTDADRLAVLNLRGKKDPTLIREFERTLYNDPSIHPVLQQETYAKVVRNLFGSTVTFRSYNRMVTFLPDVINKLNEACANVGMTPRTQNQFVFHNNVHVGNPGVVGLVSNEIQGGAFAATGGGQVGGHAVYQPINPWNR